MAIIEKNNFPRIITHKYKTNFIKDRFYKAVGHELNLDNPQTFNEKLQWIKLYYHNPLMTKCTDKFTVREFIAHTIGKKYLTKLIGEQVYYDARKIDFDKLPNRFALKANNGSGTNIICGDKAKLDIADARDKLNHWLKKGHSNYYHSFEWAYKHIKPCIIAEAFIEEKGGLKDYKFLCFNGRCELISVFSERISGELKLDWFDRDWQHLPFIRHYPNNPKKIAKPKNLAKMIKIAEKLAQSFPFVRVDLYEINGQIKFGEMTFTPGNGMVPFRPKTWDKKLGDLLQLPHKTFYAPFEFNKRTIRPRATGQEKVYHNNGKERQ